MYEKLTLRERVRALKPGQVIWPLIIVLVLLGVIVGVYNYQKNISANKVPTVEIASPSDNATVTSATTKITGSVEKGAKVTIKDKEVPVDEAGSFTYNVPLSPGLNNITIVVTGDNGKSTITSRRVTYNVPQPINKPIAQNKAVAGKLSTSGPENFWIPEAGLIAAAIVGYSMTKKELQKTLRKH